MFPIGNAQTHGIQNAYLGAGSSANTQSIGNVNSATVRRMAFLFTALHAANDLRMRSNLRMNSGDYQHIWQAGDWPN
jgi:long-subunit fatty acid transport protein